MRSIEGAGAFTIAFWAVLTVATLAESVADDRGANQASNGAGPSPTIATVNGESLTLADLERQLSQLHQTADAGQRRAFDLDRLIFRLVNDTLLGQEARALGLDREASIVNQVNAHHARLSTAALEREEITEHARASEKEIQKTFEQQYRRLTLQVVTAYQQREGEELLAKLEAGADMAELARESSVDPYAGRGGRVESVAVIDLQREIAELASSLAPGELDGPVRTDLGWSVIRLVAVEAADPERLPSLRRSLGQLVSLRKSQALRTALAQTARENHTVSIDQRLAGSVTTERLPDARLMPRLADPDGVVARVSLRGAQGSDPRANGPVQPGQAASPGLLEALTLTSEDYRKALLARWSGVRNAEAALAAAPIVLEKMIEERLLLAEALRRGYGDLPKIRHAVRAFETSLLAPRYLKEAVTESVEVNREEMEAFYQENRRQFTRPPRIHLGQITLATRKEAQRIADLLRQGTDLAWLARRHSIDRFKERGGERGWVDPTATDFSERLLDADPGEVLEPAGVRGNWVVLKVMARREQGIYTYDEVSGNVRNAVVSRKTRAAVERLMDTLRERSEIEIDRELLATLRLGATVSETPDDPPSGHGH